MNQGTNDMEKLPTKIDFSLHAPLESNDTYNAFLTLGGSKVALGTGKPVKVGGTINGHFFQVTLMPSGHGDHWLPLRKEIVKAIGTDRLGTTVTVHLTERYS